MGDRESAVGAGHVIAVRRAFAIALLGLALCACLGPKPVVRSAEVGEVQDGKATVTIVVVNTNNGDGESKLKVTLRQGDKVVGRATQALTLDPGETVTLVLEIDVPKDAHDLECDAEVAYPPD